MCYVKKVMKGTDGNTAGLKITMGKYNQQIDKPKVAPVYFDSLTEVHFCFWGDTRKPFMSPFMEILGRASTPFIRNARCGDRIFSNGFNVKDTSTHHV